MVSRNAVRVNLLDKITSGAPTVTKLPSLYKELANFSVANYRNQIFFLSGGSTNYRNRTAQKSKSQVSAYDNNRKVWYFLPRLNHSRSGHSSLCKGQKVYVFGGLYVEYRQTSPDKAQVTSSVKSIESFRVGSGQNWVLLEI